MILYIDEYQTLKHNREASLLEMSWTDATSKLSEKPYMRRMENVAYYMEQSRPVNILANLEQMTYTGSSSLLPKINKAIKNRMANMGVQKMALVKSQDVITQLMVEQLMNNQNGHNFSIQFFEDEETAKHWLDEPVN